jgi:quinol monooxygenase YgiN
VNTNDRDGYVAALRGLVSRAREFDGCIDVAITADSVDPERVDSVEVWRDAEALNVWRKRAKAPRSEKPKHSTVRRYDATDGGPLF